MRHVRAAPMLHTDDTVLRLQDESVKGKTRQAHAWAYLRAGARQIDDGTWAHYPKAVVFLTSMGSAQT